MMAVAAGATDVTTDDYDDVTEVGDAAAIRRQVGSLTHFLHLVLSFVKVVFGCRSLVSSQRQTGRWKKQ